MSDEPATEIHPTRWRIERYPDGVRLVMTGHPAHDASTPEITYTVAMPWTALKRMLLTLAGFVAEHESLFGEIPREPGQASAPPAETRGAVH